MPAVTHRHCARLHRRLTVGHSPEDGFNKFLDGHRRARNGHIPNWQPDGRYPEPHGAIDQSSAEWNWKPTDVGIDRARLWDWSDPQFLG